MRTPLRLVIALLLTAALGLVLVSGASALRFTDDSYLVPVGVVGQDYSHQFEGDGGCGPALPYQFRVLSGALPPGLSLNGDGLLIGVPKEAGSWSFWLELSDEDPPSQPWCLPRKSERRFTVDILPALAVTTGSAPPATLGTPYSLALSAQGGSGTRSWSIASGQLPPGLALDAATGEITGSPSAAGVYQFRVRVSDGSRLGSKQFTIRVREPLKVQAPAVPPYEVGLPIAALELAASGGSAMKAWRLDGALPSGLRFDASTGTITGTPKMPGSFPVQAVVSDSEARTAAGELTIVVSAKLTLAPTRLPHARTGRLYRAKVVAAGGVGQSRFKVLTGQLPLGVRLDLRTGNLSGRPRSAGIYRVVVEVRDLLGATDRRRFVLTVEQALK